MAFLYLKYVYNKLLARCDGWLIPGLKTLTKCFEYRGIYNFDWDIRLSDKANLYMEFYIPTTMTHCYTLCVTHRIA